MIIIVSVIKVGDIVEVPVEQVGSGRVVGTLTGEVINSEHVDVKADDATLNVLEEADPDGWLDGSYLKPEDRTAWFDPDDHRVRVVTTVESRMLDIRRKENETVNEGRLVGYTYQGPVPRGQKLTPRLGQFKPKED